MTRSGVLPFGPPQLAASFPALSRNVQQIRQFALTADKFTCNRSPSHHIEGYGFFRWGSALGTADHQPSRGYGPRPGTDLRPRITLRARSFARILLW